MPFVRVNRRTGASKLIGIAKSNLDENKVVRIKHYQVNLAEPAAEIAGDEFESLASKKSISALLGGSSGYSGVSRNHSSSSSSSGSSVIGSPSSSTG